MRTLALTVILLGGAATAFGQSSEAHTYLAARGGINTERAEDNLKGSTAGGGVLVGRAWSDRWAIEGEWWAAKGIAKATSLHRDTLFGLNLRRSLGSGTARPHLLFGVTAMRTVDELTTCTALRQMPFSPAPVPVLVACDEPNIVDRVTDRFTGTSLVPLVGAGVAVDLATRMVFVVDVRVQPWITSFIVRPAVSFGVKF